MTEQEYIKYLEAAIEQYKKILDSQVAITKLYERILSIYQKG